MESLNTGNKNVQRTTAFYLSFTVLSLKEKLLVYLEGWSVVITDRLSGEKLFILVLN